MAARTRDRSRSTPRPARVASPSGPDSDRITRIAVVALLLATLVLVVFVRLRVADTPLERDEGEYAYAGQLILQGIPPYEQVYNMKFPGTYYAYAAVMAVFGQTAWGIRMGLLVVHLATAAFLFALGRRITGPLAAAVGTSAFAVLALDRWTMGVFAHATHFVTLPVVAGLWVLHRGMADGRAWRFLLAGVLLGVAITMKQQAYSFAVFGVGLAFWSGRRQAESGRRDGWRRAVLVIAGLTLAMTMLVALLAAEGVLGRFWFWTFQYAAAYVSQIPAFAAPAMLRLSWGYITQATAPLWYTAAAGLALLFVLRWPADSRITLAAWVVAAALSIAPGFYFRQHYFIVLLPVAGLLVGVAVASADRVLAKIVGGASGRIVAVGLFVVLAGVYVQRESVYLFRMSASDLVRAVYDTNPFLESQEIARYLREHTTADDRVAVLGSEPQIYFYARRRSATGYIYTYPLMENQPFAPQMQDEMRREVEAARPAYLVFVASPLSWGGRPESDNRILIWANDFATRCYERVGVVDIPRAGPSVIRWDAESVGYQPREQSQVWTFRRRGDAGCG